MGMKVNLSMIADRAKNIKTDNTIRHIPSAHDIMTVNDNTKIMQPVQYESIAPYNKGAFAISQ